MLVAAGNAHAELVGHVGFDVAVGAPAPVAPASRIGRTGAAVTARARALGRGASRRCKNAGRDLDEERVRHGIRPAGVRLYVALGRTVDLLAVLGPPRQRDRAGEAQVDRI